jgi:hypothetical protein
MTLILSGRLSDLFFPFLVRKIFKRFRTAKLTSPLPEPRTVVVLQGNTWFDVLLLFGLFPKLTVLVPTPFFHGFPWINGWVSSIRLSPLDPTNSKLSKVFEKKKNTVFCLYFHKRTDVRSVLRDYEPYLHSHGLKLAYAQRKKERIRKRFIFRYYQKIITFGFQKERSYTEHI